MKKCRKKMISFLLIIALFTGLLPQIAMPGKVKAATAQVTLSNLGKVGTVSVGKKTKKGNWWKMYLGGSEMFCLNLGETCHAGDAYKSETDVYSSTDSGKKGLEACIGYWFDKTKNRSNKAYIIAQALFWAVEEGGRSKPELKSVIQTMQRNTGYYSSQDAEELYHQIFQPSGTVKINISLWRYTGSGQKRQILLDVVSTSTQKFKPKSVCSKDVYRQRITLHKTDEFGKPLSGVKFRLSADNVDELYYFKAKGLGDTDAGEVDEDADNFELDMLTDEKGQIAYRFNYNLQSQDYYYYESDELEKMDDAAKKKAIEALEDEGLPYGKSLTYTEAKDLSEKDIQNQMKEIQNLYQVQEISTGDAHLFQNSEIMTIVLGKEYSWQQLDGRWPEDITGSYENFPQAYQLNIENRYKKVKVKVVKKDAVSQDGKAHGDASLDGAQFQLYEDRACMKPANVYDQNGKRITAGTYTVVGHKFTTDYLQSGKVYYLKEVRPPRGYKIMDDVLEIHADARTYTAEYSEAAEEYSVLETPIRGRISLNKYSTDGTTGPVASEKGAQFQIYLKSAGSYEQADDYERDLITTDKDGYACTKELYYGNYKVHQISSGDLDTELVSDFEVMIDREMIQKTYHSVINNKPFKAFLRIIKKDGNTNRDVLKKGTVYQIFQMDTKTGKETLVKQSYSNGNVTQVVDQFESDEMGRIMTVDSLPSGIYRIYEREAASGFYNSNQYIEVEINSKAGNYVRETDSEGNEYTIVTLDYVNHETYGRLSIFKNGQQLKSFENGQFLYEDIFLKGAVFEIYASEAIKTQDNQKTNWFDKDALVGTVTTGVGAEFTSDCGGITGYTVEEDGMVTVNLPLGKYYVVEKQTVYGHVLPKENRWNIEFTWKDQEEKYVLNATEDTDGNGVLRVRNERARSALSLIKLDNENESPISGAVFGLYSSNDIYNAVGEKIVDANTLIGTVETDREGMAEFDLDLPLMSEGFGTEKAAGQELDGKVGLNSGDYYIQEKKVSDSYFPEDKKYPIHLEYQDQTTDVVAKICTVKNEQTAVEIDKVSVTGSGEIPGCQLQITDKDNNVIVSWISGDSESVKLDEKQQDHGYVNLRSRLDERGNLIIGGLYHGQEYTLTETRPADGYVTADSIVFRLYGQKTETGDFVTRVDILGSDGIFIEGSDNVVKMIDEQTKVSFCKLAGDRNGFLAGAQITVLDTEGKEITSFVTEESGAVELNGILAAGRTYIFRETASPEGYEKASDVSFTVQDTKEIQKVSMTDVRTKVVKAKKIPKGAAKTVIEKKNTPRSKTPKAVKTSTQPETGSHYGHVLALVLFIVFGMSAIVLGKTRYRQRRKLV